jgi:hypothetical protein
MYNVVASGTNYKNCIVLAAGEFRVDAGSCCLKCFLLSYGTFMVVPPVHISIALNLLCWARLVVTVHAVL